MDLARRAVERTGVFSCKPIDRTTLCWIEIQRGVVRTNCIDSLDRTNFAQEMIGYSVLLKQFAQLGVTRGTMQINLKSTLFNMLVDLYNTMGDVISMQYGGSIAHHSQLQKNNKAFMASLPELITSVKRHYNNNFRDPFRQSMINLFLGVFKPAKSLIEQHGVETHEPLWRIQDLPELEQQLHTKKTLGNICKAFPVESRFWWEDYFTRFE